MNNGKRSVLNFKKLKMEFKLIKSLFYSQKVDFSVALFNSFIIIRSVYQQEFITLRAFYSLFL